MVQLIIGNKGKGKTKYLLEKVNSEVKDILGNICYDTNALSYLSHLTMKELRSIPGIGEVKAVKLLCLSEIARRIVREKVHKARRFDCAQDIAEYYMEEMRHLQTETTVVLHLDSKNLRIKYNKVFGYYFEVTNSFKNMVPDDYQRKQTLVGSERYTSEKLRSLEDMILNADDKLNTLEYDCFCGIRDAVGAQIVRIQKAARALAMLDVLCSLSLTAERNRYVRPSINDKGVIRIKDGRHPVVEKMLQGDFISNDTSLDSKKNAIAIITGPNMAGKSTYMRQVALICLMAQIGSFVPAASADLCVVDRIFTRVGASCFSPVPSLLWHRHRSCAFTSRTML